MRSLYNYSLALILGLSLSLASALSHAQTSDWKYEAFPFVEATQIDRSLEPKKLRVNQEDLVPLISSLSGTHRLWAVEQVFASRDLTKTIFVKYHVKLSSSRVLGTWIKTGPGHLLHLKRGQHVTAYFAQGFSALQLSSIQQQLQTQKVSERRSFSLWMSCAEAEVVESAAQRPAENPTANPNLPAASPSILSRTAGVVRCVGAETLNRAVESGKALWDNLTWANVAGAAQGAVNSVYQAIPSRQDIIAGAQAAGNFLSQYWQEPNRAWSDIARSFEQTKKVLSQVYQKITDSVEGFRNLPPEMQDRIICHASSALALDGALGLALTATGAGVSVATVRLIAAVNKYTERLRTLMPQIQTLATSTVTSERRLEELEKILTGIDRNRPASPQALAAAGSMTNQERINVANRLLGRDLTPGQIAALNCAHEIAPERGYGSYTPQDLRRKMRILREGPTADVACLRFRNREPGADEKYFLPEEADRLLRAGIAGQAQAQRVTPAAPPNRAPNPASASPGTVRSRSIHSLVNPTNSLSEQENNQALRSFIQNRVARPLQREEARRVFIAGLDKPNQSKLRQLFFEVGQNRWARARAEFYHQPNGLAHAWPKEEHDLSEVARSFFRGENLSSLNISASQDKEKIIIRNSTNSRYLVVDPAGLYFRAYNGPFIRDRVLRDDHTRGSPPLVPRLNSGELNFVPAETSDQSQLHHFLRRPE